MRSDRFFGGEYAVASCSESCGECLWINSKRGGGSLPAEARKALRESDNVKIKKREIIVI